MTTDEIVRLPIEQKMRMTEILWEDLRERFEQNELADEHKALLDLRRKRVEAGKVRLLNWDTVKAAIGKA